jgi:hypothetical protein
MEVLVNSYKNKGGGGDKNQDKKKNHSLTYGDEGLKLQTNKQNEDIGSPRSGGQAHGKGNLIKTGLLGTGGQRNMPIKPLLMPTPKQIYL